MAGLEFACEVEHEAQILNYLKAYLKESLGGAMLKKSVSSTSSATQTASQIEIDKQPHTCYNLTLEEIFTAENKVEHTRNRTQQDFRDNS